VTVCNWSSQATFKACYPAYVNDDIDNTSDNEIRQDADIAQCSRLPTTLLTHTYWQRAHKVLTSLVDNVLGILIKAENGEKGVPTHKLLYTTLHGLCKHAKVGPCGKKVTYAK
jgi:hypothetical protein